MKTKTFCSLVEEAIRQRYGEEVDFDTVPYDHGDGNGTHRCLAVFLTEDLHMAVISAQAMYLIWSDPDGRFNDDADKDEAMGDFVDIIEGFRVAPYMQWTAIYFPGLTEDQVLSEAEPEDEGTSADGSFVPNPNQPG